MKGATRRVADIDGDGEDELMIPFEDAHRIGPSRLRIYGADGAVRGTYYVTGELTFHIADDFDADGKDEILLATTSNDPALRGFSLIALDDQHLSGVSPGGLDNPRCQIQGGCLAGVSFPAFDEAYMNALGAMRLAAWEIEFQPASPGRDARFLAWIGADPDAPAMLYLDGALSPVSATYSDALRLRLDAAAEGLGGRRFETHLAQWYQRFERFGAARIDGRTSPSLASAARDDAPRD
jgi:hypothetical protein